MNPWIGLAIVWALAAAMMSLGWLWQRRRSNSGIVDVLWSAGLGGAAILLTALGHGAFWPRALLGLLGGAWGLRLGCHLWTRVHHERREDGRYAQLRERWRGDQRKLFAMFQFQAGLIVLFSLPFLGVAANPASTPPWLAIAAAVWLLAVFGEAVADRQLARFRNDPANKRRACRDGLWRTSRHPNYFFEWLHWFAYVVLAIGSPLWALAWIGPVLMFVFLRYLSGIPFTERQALRTRGEDYRLYQQETSMLFPWFPKTSTRQGAET